MVIFRAEYGQSPLPLGEGEGAFQYGLIAAGFIMRVRPMFFSAN